MADFLLLEKLMEYINRGSPLPPYFQKQAGAYGVFSLYNSFEDCTEAELFCDTDRISEAFVKFAPMCERTGGADSKRGIKGMFTRFFTGDGKYDLITTSSPCFFINSFIKLHRLLECMDEDRSTNIRDELGIFRFMAENPEAAGAVMNLYTDRGTSRSYIRNSYYSFFSTVWVNSENEKYYVRYRWSPAAGEEYITDAEAMFLAGYSRDCCMRELYEKIEIKSYPEFELQIQLAPLEHISYEEYTDHTRRWDHKYIPVGRLRLTGMPVNYMREVNDVCFTPFNLPDGIMLGEDELTQGTAFLFSDCARRRGGNT